MGLVKVRKQKFQQIHLSKKLLKKNILWKGIRTIAPSPLRLGLGLELNSVLELGVIFLVGNCPRTLWNYFYYLPQQLR